MKIIFLLGLVVNILFSIYAFYKTGNDSSLVIFHVYSAALLVIGYVEFN